MTSFHEILWEGTVPVMFELPFSELSSVNQIPLRLHKLLPRMSYLMSHIHNIVEYFRSHTIEFSCDECIHFVVKQTILPCSFPIGPLFDAFHGGNQKYLHIQVFFRVPTFLEQGSILSKLDVERTYFHNLKQGLQILHGTSRKFGELTVEQQTDLWRSVEIGSFSHFKLVADHVIPSALPRAVPVRLFFFNGAAHQKSIKIDGNGWKSLKAVLQIDFQGKCGDCIDAIVQGVKVNLDVSIVELWMNMHHPDSFLYVSIPKLP